MRWYSVVELDSDSSDTCVRLGDGSAIAYALRGLVFANSKGIGRNRDCATATSYLSEDKSL